MMPSPPIPPSLRRALLGVALLAAAPFAAPPAAAQTLAEVTFVAATSASLDPSVQLPSGSVRAIGPGVDALLARLPDAHAWTEPEAYAARGLAANLRPAFEHQVATSFASAGYFERSRRSVQDGETERTRIEFEDAAGRRTLLVLFDAPDALVWLIAVAR